MNLTIEATGVRIEIYCARLRVYPLSRRGVSEAAYRHAAARGSRLTGDVIRHTTYLGAINS